MTEAELQEWVEDFEAFHARFAPIFGRKEPREQAQKYVYPGLVGPGRTEKQLATGRSRRGSDPGFDAALVVSEPLGSG